MNSRYSLEQIAKYVVDTALTEARIQYKDEPIVQSSKKIVDGLQSGSITEAELNTACRDVLTYFGDDITGSDIEALVDQVSNIIPMPQ